MSGFLQSKCRNLELPRGARVLLTIIAPRALLLVRLDDKTLYSPFSSPEKFTSAVDLPQLEYFMSLFNAI